ncbi:long-chain acyl-CoA synthetase [Pseudochelatococcus lubricantis]|uniref:Long-chain-fatty-acid--CoA ligase n=1 Tax=Pseudochelatococcus lubricantis TaxID=1538102 RepID=A0ABX0UXW2_9HYPH|nr:AMP-binding protein [Pseudochelatococcus lubricantis]NIJ57772.1 long-chain acyl-CoA synthetase [Pseudochelatococcus lubricantis]
MKPIWLDHYPPNAPETIDPDRFPSIPAMFAEAAGRYRDRVALSSFGAPMTYGALDRLSDDFASYLQNGLGLRAGTRVALMMPNLLQYPVALLGILKAGLVVTNVNPLYTARELKSQLVDSGAEVIVVSSLAAATLAEVRAQTPVGTVIVTGIGDLLPLPRRWLVELVLKFRKAVPPYDLPGARSLREALAIGRKQPPCRPRILGDDLAFLQYTGGTTGRAKGAMLTHRNLVANVEQVRALACLTGGGSVIVPLPLYHIFALNMLLLFMSYGMTSVLIANPRDIKGFIRTIARLKFRAIMGINTLYNAMLNHPDFGRIDFSGLRYAIAGGASTQEAVARRWRERTGVPIIEGYGLTETSPVVTFSPVVDGHEFDGSVGLPLPSMEISLRDDLGEEVAPGKEGELWVRGPNIMRGYWNAPEETDRALTADGWLKTGDIARLTDNGRVVLVDRKKDMILVSGFNVYPAEIEDVVAGHPGVSEVAVVGVPDKATGEAVRAFVVRKDPNLTEEDIVKYCRQFLTAYKTPRSIVFRDALPRSNVGKVLRRALREEG